MSQDNEARLELYLDGLLDDSARRAFERVLGSTPKLRAKVAGQSLIDASLRRLFVAPSHEVATRILEAAWDGLPVRRSATTQPRVSYSRRLAIAAMLGLGVLGVVRICGFLVPSRGLDPYAPQPWRSLETVYRDAIAGGFKPDWECKDQQEFETFVRRALGHKLLLAQTPTGISSLGLSRANTITPNTLYLLARVQGREVLVFIDRLKRDAGQSVPSNHGFQLFRRELDPFVLYEFTPLDRANLLDLFCHPQDPGS